MAYSVAYNVNCIECGVYKHFSIFFVDIVSVRACWITLLDFSKMVYKFSAFECTSKAI